ncbi:hypothetical protein VB773_15655 [Haloarculaceae archaeon H-GB2-1]|nr:hypothetical protein [Haloarculaceae archaeon H-GB2-1]
MVLAHLPLVVLYFYANLKGNPGLDSLAVAVAWAYLVVFFVVVPTGIPISIEVVTVFLAWLLIVFAGVEARNVEDVQGDGRMGNETLAGWLGPTGTLALELALKLAGVAIFWGLGGSRVALLAVFYMLLVRGSRSLTERKRYTQRNQKI